MLGAYRIRIAASAVRAQACSAARQASVSYQGAPAPPKPPQWGARSLCVAAQSEWGWGGGGGGWGGGGCGAWGEGRRDVACWAPAVLCAAAAEWTRRARGGECAFEALEAKEDSGRDWAGRKKIALQGQVRKIATLINALVDMDYFTEAEEQVIFEYCVRLILYEIEKILPPPFMHLILRPQEQGLDPEIVDDIKDRLETYVKAKVQLPYLDQTDEARVISAVCAIVAECMKAGKMFDTVCQPMNSGQLILDVFVKGTIGFLDAENKKEVIGSIADDLQIPFVPDRLVSWAVGKMVGYVGEVFEESIIEAYHRRTDRAEELARQRVEDIEASEAWQKLLSCRVGASVFSYLLPVQSTTDLTSRALSKAALPKVGATFDEEHHFIYPYDVPEFGLEVRNRLIEKLNERINVIGWMGSYLEKIEGVWIGHLVDLTLMESADIDKMENATKYLVKEHYVAYYKALLEKRMHGNLRLPRGYDDERWCKALAKACVNADLATQPEKDLEKINKRHSPKDVHTFGMKKFVGGGDDGAHALHGHAKHALQHGRH